MPVHATGRLLPPPPPAYRHHGTPQLAADLLLGFTTGPCHVSKQAIAERLPQVVVASPGANEDRVCPRTCCRPASADPPIDVLGLCNGVDSSRNSRSRKREDGPRAMRVSSRTAAQTSARGSCLPPAGAVTKSCRCFPNCVPETLQVTPCPGWPLSKVRTHEPPPGRSIARDRHGTPSVPQATKLPLCASSIHTRQPP